MNSGAIFGIIGVDVFSILVCSVLLYGNRHESALVSARSKWYAALLGTDILALAADAVSWIFDGNADRTGLIWLTSYLSIALSFVLLAEFSQYLSAYLAERSGAKNDAFRKLSISALAALLATTVICLAGRMFSVEEGIYLEGDLYWIYMLMNLATLIAAFVLIVRSSDKLGFHDSMAVYLYILIPAVSMLINLFAEEWSFAYPAATLSLLILYVMIQAERRTQLQEEGQISAFHATHDELTGLLNRRAYTEEMAKLEKSVSNVGVIFGDLNGLKYANDHFGHEAGDRMLIDFSDRLRRYFKSSEIFRISGDEFVVLLTDVGPDAFRDRTGMLIQEMQAESSPAASVGCEYGSGSRVYELVRMAESRMYAEKELFHKNHPEMNRV